MNWTVEYTTYNDRIISFAIYNADRPDDRRPIVESGNGWSHEENQRHAELILNAAQMAAKIEELKEHLQIAIDIAWDDERRIPEFHIQLLQEAREALMQRNAKPKDVRYTNADAECEERIADDFESHINYDRFQ